MSPRVFHSLVGALIRIGLLLALVIMLMAENAQAQLPLVAQPVCSSSHFLLRDSQAPGPKVPRSGRTSVGRGISQ